MKRKIYSIVFAFLFFAPAFLAAQTNVLYVARNAPADGNDPFIIAGLEDLGYNVTVVDATAGYSTDSHSGQDVVVFGEYLSSGGVVPFADDNFPLPCVSMEGYCTRSNRWALLESDDDFGQIREDNSFGIEPIIPDHYSLKIVEDHPIFSSAGIMAGDEVLWSEETTALPEVVWYDKMPQTSATSVADVSGDVEDLHTFWTLQPESSDPTNPLNHRMVIWGVHDNGFASLTTEFWTILRNSIEWSLDNPIPQGLVGPKLLYVARNAPADGNDPFIIAGLQGLGYRVTVVDATAGYSTDSHSGQDVVVFGEYLSSGGVVPFADDNFPLPCVSMEGYCTRSNRWALLETDDDFGQIREDASYVITPVIPDHYSLKVVEDHPIFANAGYNIGNEILWSSETTALPEVVWYDKMPQSAATAVADISGADENLHTFWTLQPESSDPTNPLNHRLVIWGVHDNGFAATTDEFWTILNNSILWVLEEAIPVGTVNPEVILNQLENVPNPFTNSTRILFNLKEAANVELRVFDSMGRLISTTKESLTEGEQALEYSNESLQNGTYYYMLTADGKFAGTGKMMVVK